MKKEMTLENWKEFFNKDNLDSGKSLYKYDDIYSFVQEGNIYRCDVDDHLDYSVEIKYDGKTVYDLSCNCGDKRCAHQAALLYALEDPENLYENQLAATRDFNQMYEEDIVASLEELDENGLREFILKILRYDPDLRDVFFGDLKPEKIFKEILRRREDPYKNLPREEVFKSLKQETDALYSCIMEGQFLLEEAYRVEWYGTDYYDHEKGTAYPDVEKILKRFEKYSRRSEDTIDYIRTYFLNTNYLKESYELIVKLSKALNQVHDDECIDILASATYEMYEFVKDLIAKLTEKERKEWFDYITQKTLSKKRQDYDEEKLNNFLIENLVSERENLEYKLEKVDLKIRDYKKCPPIHLIEKRIELMKALNLFEKEIESFKNEYRKYYDFIEYEFNKALNDKNYDHAFNLLDAYSEVEDANSHEQDILLDFIKYYEAVDDVENLIETLKNYVEHFYSADRNIESKIYQLRELLPKTEWDNYRDGIILRLPDIEINILKLLSEDGLYERMLKEVQWRIGDFKFLGDFEGPLVKRYPEEMRKWYIDSLDTNIDRARTRNAYREIALKLKKLKELPRGQIAVDDLLERWFRIYPNRKAMREELKSYHSNN